MPGSQILRRKPGPWCACGPVTASSITVTWIHPKFLFSRLKTRKSGATSLFALSTVAQPLCLPRITVLCSRNIARYYIRCTQRFGFLHRIGNAKSVSTVHQASIQTMRWLPRSAGNLAASWQRYTEFPVLSFWSPSTLWRISDAVVARDCGVASRPLVPSLNARTTATCARWFFSETVPANASTTQAEVGP